jgi:hypothetical protein
MADSACPSCAFPLDVGHNFCPSCGAPTPVPAEAPDPGDQDEARSRARLQGAVGSDFRVGALIGRGGFAEVFEAEDTRLQRRVAVKVLRPDLSLTSDLLERFQREARAIAALRHPNVMEIYTVGEKDGVAYFVMPLIAGESLEQHLQREGQLELDEARRILREAADALDAAHRAGTVHRDVKPDNILLDGDGRRVLIADFGIAKALERKEAAITHSGMFVGTPQYMSPEQATGDPLDHRSDIYSLGVVAFRMVAGRLPFEAHNLQALVAKHLTAAPPPLWTLRSDCPERLARVVERCLAKDPGERWESLRQMVEVLDGRAEPPPPPRMGVPGLESGRAPPAAGDARTVHDAVAALDAPLKAYRKLFVGSLAAWLILVVVDAVAGLGGLSAWVAVPVAMVLASRAARLWSAGYEWRDLLHTPPPEELGRITTAETALILPHGEDYGRFGSLVRTCTGDRATILKAFGGVPHAEQKRFPGFRDSVDSVMGRIKHVSRKVVTLEDRIAETAGRIDERRREGPGGDATLAAAALDRHAARLQELNAARDEAAGELRFCADALAKLRETLTERFRSDPGRALEELGEILRQMSEHMAGRGT